jgi:hypothetical protein
MRKIVLVLASIVTLSHATLYAIGTIKQVNLANGRDDTNKIASPMFDAGSLQPLQFTIKSGYDRGAKIVRKGATNMFTRGPEYNLDKAVDLGALFTEALRTEAVAMGFRAGGGSEAGWVTDGTIKDVYLESKQIPYGATLFYGFMDLEMQVRGPSGESQTRRMRIHNYFGGYNAGMGRKDEAEEALAHLLVEGAQETVARLNRDVFKAPTHSAIDAIVGRLGSGTTPNDIHRVGLSNAGGATPALLSLLPKETAENRRSAIIDALARLGSPEAVSTLSSRYGTEEEDCRWYTLKAMDYIGGDAALALVKSQGLKDKDGGPRRLAQRILGAE